MHRIGIIPFEIRQRDVQLLCVTSLSRGRWIFPKGRLKAGETHVEACHREGFEEAGVRGLVLVDFPLTVAVEKTVGDVLHQVPVTFYPFAVRELAEMWDEQPQRERRWAAIDEAERVLRQADYLILLRQFKTLLPWITEAASGPFDGQHPPGPRRASY